MTYKIRTDIINTMATCSGNDYILSLSIDNNISSIKYLHEKDETCKDDFNSMRFGAACRVDSDLEEIQVDYVQNIRNSEAFDSVDNISMIYIENIIFEYYGVLQIQEDMREDKDIFIINVFRAYIKYILDFEINMLEHNEHKNVRRSLGDVLHYVIAIPDEWSTSHLDTVKQHIASIDIRSIDNLIVIHHSDALIRHLQMPHYGHSFSNGEYYMVCEFKDNNFVTLYEYEIGPPIKGLKNVARHTVKKLKKVPIDYKTREYFLNTIFNGDKNELDKYNVSLETLVDLCNYNIWWEECTLYKLMMDYKTRYLGNVKESFILDKKKELSSITQETIRESRELCLAQYISVKTKIIETSKIHHNFRIIAINDSRFINNSTIRNFIDHLPKKLPSEHHIFNLDAGSVFTTGAAQIMQGQLRIDNYIPKIEKRESLNSISKGNIIYVDSGWNKNSVLLINSNNETTRIENVSSVNNNCYSLEDCFDVIKHKNQFHVSKINITDNYKRMLGLLDNKKLSNTREKNIQEDEKVDELLDRKIVPDTLKKAEPQRLFNSHLPYSSSKLISHVPRRYQKEMLIEYITCFQKHIIHHLISKNVLKREDKLTYYFSIDKSVLDTFVAEHEEIRTVLEKESIITQCIYPIKLIHREQVSAVHCKDTIECFKRVEEYLDYPQHMMQVQMNPTYIDLTLNVIMPLHKDITLSNNETVITLKRKRIQYNMVDVIGDLLWNHIQSGEEYLIKKCHEHDQSEHDDNANMYLQFINCFSRWFTREV
ncbi:hypothetical protein BDB01DRAFT_788451 [Pilobolus umbonatus]|nr:hypothetical protein BDB01DRAFT_788451 [Pilobolus umbonatus]